MKTSIYNIFLRGTTLVSKFILILFLGKYSINEINLGVYGMFTTTIALLIYIVGFDFYVFNTREILENENDKMGKVYSQFIFHLVSYLVVIPISIFIVFGFNFIPNELIWVFLLLIFSEHLGQEMFRLFSTFQKSVLANFLLFIRSGLWVWCILFDFFYLNNEIDLTKYFLVWAFFSWCSLLVSFFVLKNILGAQSSYKYKIDWRWIKVGVKTSVIFFISSLSFQVIQFSDRYMIDFFYGKKMVGVYTAYAQFTNAIEVFTFSAVTIVTYPKLIKASSDFKAYHKLKNNFLKEITIVALILVLIVMFLAPKIFSFLEKESFIENIKVFYLLIAGVFALIISNVYHYDLYIKKRDSLILRIAIFAMVLNILLNLIFIPIFGIFGAAMSTFVAFLFILVLKYYFSRISNVL